MGNFKQNHSKFETCHGLFLLKDFIDTTKNEDETVNQYFNRRNELYHKVKNAEFYSSECNQTGFILLGTC